MLDILVYSFLIFFICSFVGYFMEVLWCFLGSKKLVNRGFLCGPVIPIYGVGALLILFTLLRYYSDPVVVCIWNNYNKCFRIFYFFSFRKNIS